MTQLDQPGPAQGDTFICALCYGEFTVEGPPEEALQEKVELWGEIPLEDCATVCHGCFQEAKPQNNPELYATYLRWYEGQLGKTKPDDG